MTEAQAYIFPPAKFVVDNETAIRGIVNTFEAQLREAYHARTHGCEVVWTLSERDIQDHKGGAW